MRGSTENTGYCPFGLLGYCAAVVANPAALGFLQIQPEAKELHVNFLSGTVLTGKEQFLLELLNGG